MEYFAILVTAKAETQIMNLQKEIQELKSDIQKLKSEIGRFKKRNKN